MSRTVYLPVAVTIDDDGTVSYVTVDYEGMPWSSFDHDWVFNEDAGEWESATIEGPNNELVELAEGWVVDALAALLTQERAR